MSKHIFFNKIKSYVIWSYYSFVKSFKVSQTNTYFAINPEELQDAYIHLVGAILFQSLVAFALVTIS